MKKSRRFLVLALALVMSFALMACGAKYKVQLPNGQVVGYNTIEELYSNPDARAAYDAIIDQTLAQFQGVYSKIDTEFVGNTIKYSYYYAVETTTEQNEGIKDELDKQNWSQVISEAKDDMEKDMQIRPEKITFEYFDSTGALICSYSE